MSIPSTTEISSQIVQVLLPIAVDEPFDYSVPAGMKITPGQYVEVPFGKKTRLGVVWSMNQPEQVSYRIKPIIQIYPAPPMAEPLRAFIQKTAEYTLAPLGNVLSMSISVKDVFTPPRPLVVYRYNAAEEKGKMTAGRFAVKTLLEQEIRADSDMIVQQAKVSKAVIKGMVDANLLIAEEIILDRFAMPQEEMEPPCHLAPNITLTQEQQDAVAWLLDRLQQQSYSVTVLDGITGSGKTEVYSAALLEMIQGTKQGLILLPEIVLTSQLVERLKTNFGITPTLWHSALTPSRRRDNWIDIVTGKAKLVIGARSALYLPYKNLGMIVVDEEHEASYKQEEGVIYHGRDMAVLRSNIEGIACVLASASPSLETWNNIEQGKFDVITLKSRYGSSVLPDIEVVDMRLEKLNAQSWLSEPLKQQMAEVMAAGEQSLLFLNRRGYAPLTLCRKCGHRFQCPNCSTWLVEHRYPPHLQCHQCGYHESMPSQCPECESEGTLAPCGPGVERLEEEVSLSFPNARIGLMTSDNTSQAGATQELLDKIHARKIDIIIGTQMVAKGHHFPHLSLVGVVDADMGLEGGDLRAAERSYQLLSQVSGRAGRAHTSGKAVIQSYAPENLVIDALKAGDRDAFLDNESKIRQRSGVTPFGRMAAIIISGKESDATQKIAYEFLRHAPQGEGIRILGPSPAPLALLRGQYRFRMLVVTKRNVHIQKLLRHWLSLYRFPSSCSIKVDIDPYSFM